MCVRKLRTLCGGDVSAVLCSNKAINHICCLPQTCSTCCNTSHSVCPKTAQQMQRTRVKSKMSQSGVWCMCALILRNHTYVSHVLLEMEKSLFRRRSWKHFSLSDTETLTPVSLSPPPRKARVVQNRRQGAIRKFCDSTHKNPTSSILVLISSVPGSPILTAHASAVCTEFHFGNEDIQQMWHVWNLVRKVVMVQPKPHKTVQLVWNEPPQCEVFPPNVRWKHVRMRFLINYEEIKATNRLVLFNISEESHHITFLHVYTFDSTCTAWLRTQ